MHENEPWNRFDLLGPLPPDPSPEWKATMEAMDRLNDLGDPKDLILSLVDKSSHELERYLAENEAALIPEEKFYLQTTIAYRKQLEQGKGPKTSV